MNDAVKEVAFEDSFEGKMLQISIAIIFAVESDLLSLCFSTNKSKSLP